MKCTAYQEIILWNVECSTSIICIYILMRPKHDTWEWPEIVLKEGKEIQHKEGFFATTETFDKQYTYSTVAKQRSTDCYRGGPKGKHKASSGSPDNDSA